MPQVRAERLCRALARLGFVVVRQSGSHVVMRKDTKTLVIPMHQNRDVKRGTLASILKAAELTIDDLLEVL